MRGPHGLHLATCRCFWCLDGVEPQPDLTPLASQIDWGAPREAERTLSLSAQDYTDLAQARTFGEAVEILERAAGAYRLTLHQALDLVRAQALELADLRQQLAESRQMLADRT